MSTGIRLHVGCGRQYMEGWTNVDIVVNPQWKAPDIVAPAWNIPLPDKSVAELLSVHSFEHFYRWECDTVLAEWRRLMLPRALLVLEMPDLLKFCKNVLEGRGGKHPDQLGLWGMYGDPRDRDPFMAHHWGWTFTTLAAFLETNGFADCVEEPTQWHASGKEHRDFRLTARRTGK